MYSNEAFEHDRRSVDTKPIVLPLQSKEGLAWTARGVQPVRSVVAHRAVGDDITPVRPVLHTAQR